MNDILPYGYLIVGLIILTLSADYLVRGAQNIALRLNIFPLVIGLTIVALGTSLPELIVSIRSAILEVPGLAVGNIVGSNIANIMLIIGVGSIISPIPSINKGFIRDCLIMVGATIIFTIMALFQLITAAMGLSLIVLLFIFLCSAYIEARKSGNGAINIIDVEELDQKDITSLGTSTIWTILGLIGVAIGAELLVDGGTSVAENMGVSKEVIGLTMIAIGTSLPELATVIAAAVRRQSELIIGNVLGSNIFNLLGVIGCTAMIRELPISQEILRLDIWIMLGVSILLPVFMYSKNQISRWEGGILIISYIFYVISQFNDSNLIL